MEVPTSFSADAIRNEKLNVLVDPPGRDRRCPAIPVGDRFDVTSVPETGSVESMVMNSVGAGLRAGALAVLIVPASATGCAGDDAGVSTDGSSDATGTTAGAEGPVTTVAASSSDGLPSTGAPDDTGTDDGTSSGTGMTGGTGTTAATGTGSGETDSGTGSGTGGGSGDRGGSDTTGIGETEGPATSFGTGDTENVATTFFPGDTGFGTTFFGETEGETFGGTGETEGDPPPVGPGDCGTTWATEYVATTTVALDLMHTIQIAPDGSLHAFFNDNLAAYHAERVGGVWEFTQFLSPTVWAQAGAVDAAGVVHLAFRSNGDDVLYYARRIDGVWTVEDDEFGGCTSASMQLGADGTVHIAGHLGTDTLCYGTRSVAGVWATEEVGDAFHRGASLQLDADDNAHISFYSPGLRYATNQNGPWAIENLGSGGIDSTMAADSAGTFYIGHSTSPSGTIQLEIGESGAFSGEVIAPSSANFHTAAPGVAIDATDALHLIHPDPADERCLVHRTRDSEADPWVTDVAVDDNAGLASIAVDATGTPHVLYWSLDGDVRYASPGA